MKFGFKSNGENLYFLYCFLYFSFLFFSFLCRVFPGFIGVFPGFIGSFFSDAHKKPGISTRLKHNQNLFFISPIINSEELKNCVENHIKHIGNLLENGLEALDKIFLLFGSKNRLGIAVAGL